MIKRPIKEYILIGTSIRYIQDCKVGDPIKQKGRIRDNIVFFLRELDKLDLNVTKRASKELKIVLNELNNLEENAVLDEPMKNKVVTTMTSLRKTFQAETEGVIAIIITDKRYSIEKLQNISTLLDDGIYNKLSVLARYDLDEMGLCICFERSTAAAFHLLRATEEVLRFYHKSFIKKKSTSHKTWGNYTNELKNKTSGKRADITILNQLDNIRIHYRNPTQHPDLIYDMGQIQNLLGVCLDVINRMGKTFK